MCICRLSFYYYLFIPLFLLFDFVNSQHHIICYGISFPPIPFFIFFHILLLSFCISSSSPPTPSSATHESRANNDSIKGGVTTLVPRAGKPCRLAEEYFAGSAGREVWLGCWCVHVEAQCASVPRFGRTFTWFTWILSGGGGWGVSLM